MALNFPDNPTLGETYTDNTSGFSYEWDGVVWRSYSVPSVSNIKLLDDISGLFNNVLLTFPLTVNGQAVLTATSKQLILSIGGVIQSPSIDFNVVGSNIVFTTAPTAGLSFFGTLLGGAQIEVEYSYGLDPVCLPALAVREQHKGESQNRVAERIIMEVPEIYRRTRIAKGTKTYEKEADDLEQRMAWAG